MVMVKSAKVAKTAAAASVAAPYVRRLMSDAELRQELRNLFRSASHLYDELGGDDRLHKLVSDRKVRRDIDQIVGAMQHAGQRVEKDTRESHWARTLMMLSIISGVAGLFIYPRTRQYMMDYMSRSGQWATDTVEPFAEKAL